MIVATLQKADCWLGIPLCLALTCLRRLFGGSTPPPSARLHNLLLVKLAEQGSTVLAYAALRRATSSFSPSGNRAES